MDTVKPLEENRGRSRSDINHNKFFLNPPLRIKENKPKETFGTELTLKKKVHSRGTLNGRKGEHSEWVKDICK